MKKYKIIIFGDLPIATKVAEWVRNRSELELVGGVQQNKNAHNHDPWPDVPMFADWCNKENIRLFELDELLDTFEVGEVDLGLSCRYGKIVKNDIISLFKIGIINMHGGLLPEFGGCYSSNFSVIFGNGKGGGTLHWIDTGIDTGEIIKRCEFDILPNDTAFDVFQKTEVVLYENIIDIIIPILKGTYAEPYINQQELIDKGYEHRYFKLGSIHAYKQITLDMDAEEISKVIRACDFPGYEPAWILDKHGKKIYLRYHF